MHTNWNKTNNNWKFDSLDQCNYVLGGQLFRQFLDVIKWFHVNSVFVVHVITRHTHIYTYKHTSTHTHTHTHALASSLIYLSIFFLRQEGELLQFTWKLTLFSELTKKRLPYSGAMIIVKCIYFYRVGITTNVPWKSTIGRQERQLVICRRGQ